MGGGDHWRWPLMDGVDDLGVVDPAQVDRGDGEIGMPELALDNEQRHPLARHLDRVRVAQLMRRKTPPDTGVGGGMVQLRADAGGRPRAAGGRAAQYAELGGRACSPTASLPGDGAGGRWPGAPGAGFARRAGGEEGAHGGRGAG